MAEKKLKFESFKRGHRNCPVWNDAFKPLLEDSSENKSLFNNTSYMIYLYERYGYERRYMFLDNEEMRLRFVMIEREDGAGYVLVTILKMEVDNVRAHIKYSKKTKEAPAVHVPTVNEIMLEKNWDLETLRKTLRKFIDNGALVMDSSDKGTSYMVFHENLEIKFFVPEPPLGFYSQSRRLYRLNNMEILGMR